VVYAQTGVLLGSSHIDQDMVYISHFLILSRPKSGGAGGCVCGGQTKTKSTEREYNMYAKDSWKTGCRMGTGSKEMGYRQCKNGNVSNMCSANE